MGEIFKAYDIRGIYPEDINEGTVYKIAQAYVQFMKPKSVALGMDVRASSPALHNAALKALTEMGCDVVDIGLCSTDMFYFAVNELGVDGGLTVTASHNPAEYNGIKVVREKAIPIGGDSGLLEIKRLMQEPMVPAAEPGNVSEKNILSDFVEFCHGFVDTSNIKPMKIVMDTGNGSAGIVVREMFEDLPIEIIPMYFELDGTFPNHMANPLVYENRKEIMERVVKEKADLGIAWDGDADRVFFIDEKGEFVAGDFILGFLSQLMLQKKQGSKILYDVRCSTFVEQSITQHAGQPIKFRVGHAFIKQKMREEDAVLGGELSGHYYYKHHDFYADNGWIPALQLLEFLSLNETTLSQLLEVRKQFHKTEEINSRVEDKEAAIARVKETYKDGKQSFIDGITIEYDDWWFNLRVANTEPVIRLNLEANSEALKEEKTQEVLDIIRQEGG